MTANFSRWRLYGILVLEKQTVIIKISQLTCKNEYKRTLNTSRSYKKQYWLSKVDSEAAYWVHTPPFQGLDFCVWFVNFDCMAGYTFFVLNLQYLPYFFHAIHSTKRKNYMKRVIKTITNQFTSSHRLNVQGSPLSRLFHIADPDFTQICHFVIIHILAELWRFR